MKITTPGRTLVFLSVLTLCVFVGSASSAQTLDHAAATSSTMKAEVSDSMRSEILALDDRLTEIYKRSDWPALAKLVAPDYLGSWGGSFKADFSTLQREFPKVHLISFHREAAEVKQLAPGVMLLNENGSMQESYAEQDVSGRYRFTMVWVRRARQWQLLFEQELPLPAAPTGSGTSAPR